MTKGVDERIDEGVLRCFGHVQRMKNDRISKRVYVGECTGSRSEGRPRKRWIDTVKECFKKARGMVHDRSEWRGFVRGNVHLTLTRCRSCGSPQLYEALGWRSVYSRAYNFKGIKGKTSFFLSFLL